eukprot:717829_1
MGCRQSNTKATVTINVGSISNSSSLRRLNDALVEVSRIEKSIDQLSRSTYFDALLIRRLHCIFQQISRSLLDDGAIDSNEFATALELKPKSLLASRLFNKFNVTKTGKMNFREFIQALSLLSESASLHEKAEFSFSLYDLDNNGQIDHKELRALVVNALEESDVHLPDDTIDLICKNTFRA